MQNLTLTLTLLMRRKSYFKAVDKVLVGLCLEQGLSSAAVDATSSSVSVRTVYPDFSSTNDDTAFNTSNNIASFSIGNNLTNSTFTA